MNLDATLEQLAHDPAATCDLAELALHLARDEYPDLKIALYLEHLEELSRESRRRLRGDLEMRVAGLCHYLFQERGFRGNCQDYYDPRNSYLNDVLDRRLGIPISLSVLVMAVGARVGLQIEGVGLPGHFIVKAVGPGREILFDPFHGGRLLTPGDCELLVQQVTGRPFEISPEHLTALPLGLLVQRLLNNLRFIYLRRQDYCRAARILRRMRQLDPEDARLHRDLGLCYVHLGQEGRAIDHLRSYLLAQPQAPDRESICRLLRQAQRHLARWN